MALSDTGEVIHPENSLPDVNTLTLEDLKDALRLGLSDFKAKPTYALMVVFLYPVVALMLVRAALGYDLFPFLFPLTAGFALIGPIAATGLYQISRKLEKGEDVKIRNMFKGIRSTTFTSLLVMAAILLAVFVAWQWTAINLYLLLFGSDVPTSFSAFADQVLSGQNGLLLFFIGNMFGFVFAMFVLTISVVSIPMILHRDASAFDAIITSVRLVFANKKVMAIWGIVVAAGVIAGVLPFFFGLAATFPILGHATWHLYRRAVV